LLTEKTYIGNLKAEFTHFFNSSLHAFPNVFLPL